MKKQDELLYVDLPNLIHKILKYSTLPNTLSINIIVEEIKKLISSEIENNLIINHNSMELEYNNMSGDEFRRFLKEGKYFKNE